MKDQIAFIGLGKMGFPLAHHLLEAGYPLAVYNRSKEKADPLVKKGASLLNSPREALQHASIVITMVSNDAALEEIVYGPQGFGQALKEGDIHLSMSTIAPAMSRRLEAYHQERKAFYVAAPVMGRPEAAKERKLWTAVAGNSQAKQKVRPLLELMTQQVFDFGEQAEQANVTKLLCNFLIFSAIESLAEALTLAEKSQIDVQSFWALISQTLFACPVYKIYGQVIVDQNYEGGDFKMSLGYKDLHLLLELAHETKTPLPFAHLLSDRFVSALAKGHENLDTPAFTLGVREAAGLPVKEL